MRTSSPKVEISNKKPNDRIESSRQEEVQMSDLEKRIWIFFLITAAIITTISDLLGLTGAGIVGSIVIVIYPATVNTLFATRLYKIGQFDIWDGILGVLGLVIPGSNLFRFLMKIRKWEQIAQEAKQKIQGGRAKSLSLSSGKIKQLTQIRTSTPIKQKSETVNETLFQSSQHQETPESEETQIYQSEDDGGSIESLANNQYESERIEEILPGEKTYFQENTQERYKKLIETEQKYTTEEEPVESKQIKKDIVEEKTKKPSPARIALEGRSQKETSEQRSEEEVIIGITPTIQETELDNKQIQLTEKDYSSQRKTIGGDFKQSTIQETESNTNIPKQATEKTIIENREKLQEEHIAAVSALLNRKEYEKATTQTTKTDMGSETIIEAVGQKIKENPEQKNTTYPTFEDITKIPETPKIPEYKNELSGNVHQEIPLPPLPEKTEHIDVDIYEQKTQKEIPTVTHSSHNKIQSKTIETSEPNTESNNTQSKTQEQFTEIEEKLFKTPIEESENNQTKETSVKEENTIQNKHQEARKKIEEIRQKAAQKAHLNRVNENNQFNTKNQTEQKEEQHSTLRADQIKEKITKERAEKEKALAAERKKRAEVVGQQLTADIMADIEKASGQKSSEYTEKDNNRKISQNNTINLKDIPQKKTP